MDAHLPACTTTRMEQQKQHLVFVAIAFAGHLISAVELAKLILRLSPPHHLTVTIIIFMPYVPDPHLSSFLSSTSLPNLSFLHLPPLSLPPQTPMPTLFDLYMPHVRSALHTLLSSSPVTALVLDFLCSNMIQLGLELGIPPYVFFTSGASTLGLLLHYPTYIYPLIPVDKKVVEMEGESVPFPGFSSKLPFVSFPDVLSFGQFFIDTGLRMRKARGLLVNTFEGLQRGPIKALEEGLYLPEQPNPPVYSVGPLLSLRSGSDDHKCIGWLDKQPKGSVVFLCFGSGGSFPDVQVREIAVGLERSGHRFLWVVRAPSKEGEPNGLKDAVLEEVLPDGFLERTRERGLVWPSLAPQTDILGHEAVGGFVTHCGWNSFLESLWFGVPMAAWPLYAEQHLNAFEMVNEMGVAVTVRTDRVGGNRASAEEVERAVRVLMGEESGAVRKKVMEMKEEARKAVEVGGSSHSSTLRLMEQWFEGGPNNFD